MATVRAVLSGEMADASMTLRESLNEAVTLAANRRDHGGAWLLAVGLTGSLPTSETVRAVRRHIEMDDIDHATIWLLNSLAPLAVAHGNAHAQLMVVTDRVLVDVNFTAKSDFLTGIQRVVRGVAAEWQTHHDAELVVWTSRGGAYRKLTGVERERLSAREGGRFKDQHSESADETAEILVPWGVPIVLTEVPMSPQSDRLAALAEHTTSSLRLIGYDCIPVSSAETVPLDEPEKFGHYLELVKFADRVAGISRTATAEFEGFVSSLKTQGLTGPRVSACSLPTTVPVAGGQRTSDPGRPVVVCIGTVGRRKNQASLVEAAEVLWRDGLDFELRLFGHLGAEKSPLVGLVPELQAAGRPLVVETGVSDARIAETLGYARCLVFPSLHEGFGLPVVEALSHGVPVITSDFGSLREVAEGQGGVLVDPEDLGALVNAMREVLIDDDLHHRLVTAARERSPRTWIDYSIDLWEALLG